MFLHLMVIAMVTGDTAPPEAVLTQVVVIATLAFVTKTHERLAVTSFTLDGVKDW